jgi:hypothetical protein
MFGINTEHYRTRTQKLLHLSDNQLSETGMILGILFAVTVISCTVHPSLPTAEHEYPLMHFTKLISEENLTAGIPLVIVLPLAEEDTSDEDVGYLVEKLHTSVRWPILV